MSGSCPFCASTDVADTVAGACICLDCEKQWTPKNRRKVR